VNAADSSGETIRVADGSYTEQVHIGAGKDGLHIVGETKVGVTIKAPAVLSVTGTSDHFGGDAVRANVTVTGVTGVTIQNLTVDGNFAGDTTPGSNGDEISGIAYLHASGTVDSVVVKNVSNSAGGGLFGLQHGDGILVDNGSGPQQSITISNSSVHDFQKTGILVWNANVDVHGNDVEGIGPTSLTAQNALQIGGSQGVIGGVGVLSNTFGGVGYIPAGTTSTDLIVYEPTGALDILNNHLNGTAANTVGIDLTDVASGKLVTIQGNTIGTGGMVDGVDAYTFEHLKGLNSNPSISGNTFVGITGDGIFFDPEFVADAGTFTTSTVFNQTGSQFSDYLHGSSGADTLSSGGGNDTVVWNAGDGNDTISGGNNGTAHDDTDTLDVAARGHNLTLTAGSSNFTVSQDGAPVTNTATVSEVEEVSITLSGGETITINGDFTGTGIAQHTITIDGHTGTAGETINTVALDAAYPVDIKFTGGTGSDTLIVGTGTRLDFNGGGNTTGTGDTIDFSHVASGIVIDSSGHVSGGATGTVTNVENIIGTAAATDRVEFVAGYTVTLNNDGSATVSNGTTTKNLFGIEHIVVGGTEVTFVDHAPVFDASSTVTLVGVPGKINFGPSTGLSGSFVAFQGSDSVPGQGDGNTNGSMYLYDRVAGVTTNMSDVAHIPDAPAGESYHDLPMIGGKFVVFQGEYPFTFDNGNGGTFEGTKDDIYIYDRSAGTTTRLVDPITHNPINGGAVHISGDGQLIAFEHGENNGKQDVVVTNHNGNILTSISSSAPNFDPNDHSAGNLWSVYNPNISGDGRFVSFWSTSPKINVGGTDFLTGNSAGTAQVYVYDRFINQLTKVSVDSNGAQGNANSSALNIGGNSGDNDDWAAALSGDGRFVVFQSNATNLVAGGTSQGETNVFVYDTWHHTTQLVSTGPVGSHGNSIRPAISPDGLSITFTSDVSGEPGANGAPQTYIVAIDPVTGLVSGAPHLLSSGFDGFNNGFNELGNTISTGGVHTASGGAALAFNPDHGQAVHNSNGTLTFSNLSVSDYNASAEVTLTLHVDHGTLAPVNPSAAGLSIVGGNDGSHGTLEVRGSIDAINHAAQSGVVYTPNAGATSDTLTQTLADPVNGTTTQAGNFDAATGQFTGGSETGQKFDIFLVDRSATSGALIEDSNVDGSGNVSATGTLKFTDADLADTHSVTATFKSAVTSDGAITNAGILSLLNSALTASVAHDSTGTGSGQVNWSIAVPNSNLQGLGVGQGATVVYTLALADGHGGTASQDVTITIMGADDAPVITWNTSQAVAATAGVALAIGSTNSPVIADTDTGNNEPLKVTVSVAHGSLQLSQAAPNDGITTLDNNGGDGSLTFLGTISQIDQVLNGQVAYTATANYVGSDTFTLRVDDGHDGIASKNLTINVSAGSGGGGSTTITSANSIGVIPEDGDHYELNGSFEKGSFIGWTRGGTGSFQISSGAAHTGLDGATILPARGSATLSQIIGSGPNDTLDFWLKGGDGNPNHFSVSWNGQTYTPTQVGGTGANGFNEYRIDNLPSVAGPALLQFTFQGTSVWSLDDVAFTSTGVPGLQTDLGNINFQDTNSADQHHASAAPHNGVTGYVGNFFLVGGNNGVTQQSDGSGFVQWKFQVDNSGPNGIQYLAEGQTIHQLYDVTIYNDNNASDTKTQTVDVTLVGHNDAPVIQSGPESRTIHAPTGDTVSSNNFSYVDLDTADTHSVAVHLDPASPSQSSLGVMHVAFDSNNSSLVSWDYTLSGNAVNSLAPGTVLHEVYDIVVSDNHGGSATKQVSIEIDGPTGGGNGNGGNNGNSGDGSVVVPLDLISPATTSDISVNWGDGSNNTTQSGVAPNSALHFTHNYRPGFDGDIDVSATGHQDYIVHVAIAPDQTVMETINSGDTLHLVRPLISGDGQNVAFNDFFLPNPANPGDFAIGPYTPDVMLYDSGSGTAIAVAPGVLAVAPTGVQNILDGYSADGNHVLYNHTNTGEELVADVNVAAHTHTTRSIAGPGTEFTVGGVPITLNGAGNGSIDHDGNIVAFYAWYHLTGDQSLTQYNDIFVLDRTSGDIKLVSGSAVGQTKSGPGDFWPKISDDGTTVAYQHYIDSFHSEIIVKDLVNNAVYEVPNSDGAFGDNGFTLSGNGHLLALGTTSGVYLFDRDTDTTTQISTTGSPAFISADGHDVTFTGNSGIEIYDVASQTTTTVSGSQGGLNPSLSDDGRYVAYTGNTNPNDIVVVDTKPHAELDANASQDNILVGGKGDTTLVGNTGNDTLIGGSGHDQFVFTADSGHDTVINFTPGQDHINLDYVAFTPGDINSFNSWLTSHSTVSGNDLLIDLNVNGQDLHHDTILLKNVTLAGLHANDFNLPAGFA
jgi:VCBS repeat-containing protein